MSAQSRKLRGSLESSWGEADYASDEDGSVHSASDPASDPASEVDLGESDQEVLIQAEPAPASPQPKAKRTPAKRSTPPNRPQRAPAATSAKSTPLRSLQTPGSPKSTPRSKKHMPEIRGENQYEQSFIMPSMHSSPNGHLSESPMRGSQVRSRKPRSSTPRDPPTTPSRINNRKVSRHDKLPSKRSKSEEELGPWHYLNLFSEHVAFPLIAYIVNVFSYGMRHVVKPFLGLALGIGILVFSIRLASGFVRSTLSNALLAPICLIPGSSYIVPFCAPTPHEEHQANFEELISVQSQFEDILDASKDTSQLPSTIKNSELAIRDLRTLVRHSQLPSRKSLDNEFEYFVQTAGEASQDLSRYNSRIGAAMDRVIATNTWTMAVLQGLEESEASIGAVGRAVSAITGAFIAPGPSLQERIFDQYILHVSKNKEEITGLIETAQALLKILQNLDDRLGTIYAITVNDDQTITKNQEELLSSLWTKLGRNRKGVKENERQLNLLKNISAYRKRAVMHVSETLLKLQEIQAELENLREGVAAPEILGPRNDLPLTYHLSLIEKGVERLRIARGESMRVEGESYRKMVRGGQDADAKELPGGNNMPTISVRSR